MSTQENTGKLEVRAYPIAESKGNILGSATITILGLVAVLYGSKRLPFSPQTTPAICGNARQISLFATEAMTLLV